MNFITLFAKIIRCLNNKWSLRLLLCDVPILSLPKSTLMAHPIGITISPGTIIGKNCIIRQNVTIGRIRTNKDEYLPFHSNHIGDNVDIGAGAMILGENIVIGNNVKIAAGAIVLKSVPNNTTVIGIWK